LVNVPVVVKMLAGGKFGVGHSRQRVGQVIVLGFGIFGFGHCFSASLRGHF
jgi:hypothetical protein